MENRFIINITFKSMSVVITMQIAKKLGNIFSVFENYYLSDLTKNLLALSLNE